MLADVLRRVIGAGMAAEWLYFAGDELVTWGEEIVTNDPDNAHIIWESDHVDLRSAQDDNDDRTMIYTVDAIDLTPWDGLIAVIREQSFSSNTRSAFTLGAYPTGTGLPYGDEVAAAGSLQRTMGWPYSAILAPLWTVTGSHHVRATAWVTHGGWTLGQARIEAIGLVKWPELSDLPMGT